jgi:hypothetical protein
VYRHHHTTSLTIGTGSLILTFFPVVALGPLKQKCEDMFNHPKECGPIRRTLVFGVLFELCVEFSEDRSDAAVAQRYSVLARIFLAKLEKAIAELPLIMKPSAEAITALIMAVSLRIGPIFYATLTASRLHQRSTYASPIWPYRSPLKLRQW